MVAFLHHVVGGGTKWPSIGAVHVRCGTSAADKLGHTEA